MAERLHFRSPWKTCRRYLRVLAIVFVSVLRLSSATTLLITGEGVLRRCGHCSSRSSRAHDHRIQVGAG